MNARTTFLRAVQLLLVVGAALVIAACKSGGSGY
jgi:hypothetical protein